MLCLIEPLVIAAFLGARSFKLAHQIHGKA